MFSHNRVLKAGFVVVLAAISMSSFADSGTAASHPAMNESQGPMSAEMKVDLADMYQKMAVCMKTDQSMEQCQQEIMKTCPVMAKTGKCPLQDGMQGMTNSNADQGAPMKDMPME